MTKSKPLTPGQLQALKIIEKEIEKNGRYHRGQPNMHALNFIREDVLVRLRDGGYIESAQPFATLFYHVTLTEKGARALLHERQRLAERRERTRVRG